MPPVGTNLYTEQHLHEAILADRRARESHHASHRFMDELDAALAGEAWIHARLAFARRMAYSSDTGAQAQKVKWCALFDSHDRLVYAYLLVRDELNWTQLTLVDAFGTDSTFPSPAAPELSLLVEVAKALRDGEISLPGAAGEKCREMLRRAEALLGTDQVVSTKAVG